jgi:hypothetical protein
MELTADCNSVSMATGVYVAPLGSLHYEITKMRTRF